MLDLTNDQWIMIGLIFLAGLIVGFLIKPSGAKWRGLYEAEHEQHKRLRADYDRLKTAPPTVTTSEPQRMRTGAF